MADRHHALHPAAMWKCLITYLLGTNAYNATVDRLLLQHPPPAQKPSRGTDGDPDGLASGLAAQQDGCLLVLGIGIAEFEKEGAVV